MKTKSAYLSKELWLAVGVIANSILFAFGLPAVPLTPEIVGAVGILFFAIRTWSTDAAIVWKKVAE